MCPCVIIRQLQSRTDQTASPQVKSADAKAEIERYYAEFPLNEACLPLPPEEWINWWPIRSPNSSSRVGLSHAVKLQGGSMELNLRWVRFCRFALAGHSVGCGGCIGALPMGAKGHPARENLGGVKINCPRRQLAKR